MRLLEIHIETDDLDRSLVFYRRLLPHKKLVRWPDGSAVALVLEDGGAFGIWERAKRGLYGGQAADHLHFALQIEPAEYDGLKARLEDLGVEPIEHVWESGQRSLYFFDPDGHQGEFMTVDWLDGGFGG
jgi:catechol 2,3-dioxygenase-like lactoylglutathione lyase family enzyme